MPPRELQLMAMEESSWFCNRPDQPPSKQNTTSTAQTREKSILSFANFSCGIQFGGAVFG